MGPAIRVAVMAHHTTCRLILNGYFKSLSYINTALVPFILSIDIPTHMEPRFISKNCRFWVKETNVHRQQKPVTETCSCF
jgi:hypothetical protein